MGSGSGAVCSISLNTVLTPEQQALYQDSGVIRDLLEQAKTIVIVGLSAERQKASYFVATYLKREGYRVIPVNPRGGTILGETVYPDLQSVPDQVDIVDVFRPSSEVPLIAAQAIAKGAKALWTQLRIVDFAGAEKARQAGLAVVMDKCVKMEHGRFFGGLHWAGMNTELITARRAKR